MRFCRRMGMSDISGSLKPGLLSGQSARLPVQFRCDYMGYDPEEAAGAGVIAIFGQNGFVLPGTGAESPEEGRDSRPAGAGQESGVDEEPATLSETEAKLSRALFDDLATERAMLVAAAPVEDPGLAFDAMLFCMASSFFPICARSVARRVRGISRGCRRRICWRC